jgi:hypothetical protein
MQAIIILADHAQAADGKLNVIGGGWNITTAGPANSPSALGVVLSIEYHETNVLHRMQLRLVDEDSGPVMAGDQAVEIPLDLEQGRPPGLPAGAAQNVAFAFNMSPMPMLRPGTGYRWELLVDNTPLVNASASFRTREA